MWCLLTHVKCIKEMTFIVNKTKPTTKQLLLCKLELKMLDLLICLF